MGVNLHKVTFCHFLICAQMCTNVVKNFAVGTIDRNDRKVSKGVKNRVFSCFEKGVILSF